MKNPFNSKKNSTSIRVRHPSITGANLCDHHKLAKASLHKSVSLKVVPADHNSHNKQRKDIRNNLIH